MSQDGDSAPNDQYPPQILRESPPRHQIFGSHLSNREENQLGRAQDRRQERNFTSTALNDLLFEALSSTQRSYNTDSARSSPFNPPTYPEFSYAYENISALNGDATSRRTGESKIECAICLSFCQNPASSLCGHVFCEGCIKSAISKYHRCPICKRELTLMSIHPLFI
ncbi:peroxisome biogenesis factor 10-like isoform X1 [Hermetia illucens]|uniref:peroxisome biogenesis factor 10-like isoform X1 n=1 Tax=Hermetia illucens TaxID=343691 RepID=UPI0018CBFF0E|nr:peroxisome biogenesis factor 10-like isoform X1 [Hermetia illucens]XP_037911284.1 peroxisome biogenesis factor 10-like isoform X1 [Hermetia illucens]